MARYVGLKIGKVHEEYVFSEYYCGSCGFPVTDHDSFCPECGGALRESDADDDENAKLRELASEYIAVADNLCRDGFLCGPLSHCRYYEECGGKFYCKPGELKQKAESLGIEVPDGRA